MTAFGKYRILHVVVLALTLATNITPSTARKSNKTSNFYTVYNCYNGNTTKFGNIRDLKKDNPATAEVLWQQKFLRIRAQDKISYTGKVLILMGSRVYEKTCEKLRVKYVATYTCWHAMTVNTVDEFGNNYYVDGNYFVVKRPAALQCPHNADYRTTEQYHSSVANMILLRYLEQDHSLAALSQARQDEPLEDFYFLFKNESSLLKLARALESCLCNLPADSFFAHANEIYRKFIAKIIFLWSMAHLAYTMLLAAMALYLRVGLKNASRLLFPGIRRTYDLLSFRREQKIMQQLKEKQKRRRSQGLQPDLDLGVYTRKHLADLYKLVLHINERLDNANIPMVEEDISEAEQSSSAPGSDVSSTATIQQDNTSVRYNRRN